MQVYRELDANFRVKNQPSKASGQALQKINQGRKTLTCENLPIDACNI